MESSGIQQINNTADLDAKALRRNHDPSKLVVLEYMVPWSELCKFMNPAVTKIAKKYKDYAEFYTLDVDKFKEHARNRRVEALPTFLLLKNGEECNRIVGINKEVLERSIKEHSGAPDIRSDDDNNAVEEPKPPTDSTKKDSPCIIL